MVRCEWSGGRPEQTFKYDGDVQIAKNNDTGTKCPETAKEDKLKD